MPIDPQAATMVQLLVRVPADLHAELVKDAKEEDRTIAATVRRALRLYFSLDEDQR
jgi:predicted HicB family RNase H-like nuclease